jgi:hypothetical protein
VNDIPTNAELFGWIVMLIVGLVVLGIILAAGKSAGYVDDQDRSRRYIR